MRKILFILAGVLVFCGTAFAGTIYLPTSSSSQYLPTVKIFSYSLSYDGSLIGEGYGSGTLIDSSGIILTNNHVVENYFDSSASYDAFQICLTKSNNVREPVCEFTASLVARDADRDIAILKMDPKDVRGNSVSFNFYLPYTNSGNYEVGEKVTVIGYPDTGGSTITYTSGLISGFLNEGGVNYIKTDADISFGNSGGTAVSEGGNFIGIPSYIVGSYSAEVLGYLFPVEDAVSWIAQNKGKTPVKNEVAEAGLKSSIVANINANEKGYYQNDYPPYKISLTSGWKFGNNLESTFDSSGGYGSYGGSESVTIYPADSSDLSQLYINISVSDYAYNVTLDDVEFTLDSYLEDSYGGFYGESAPSHERVYFNDYNVVKETYSYYDWTYEQNLNFVTYYLPYGDKVINVFYSYSDGEEGRLPEANKILDTFNVDMSKVQSGVVKAVDSSYPKIRVENPLSNVYLSDDSYDYGGDHYFSASFGKKRDFNFYISIYSNYYWDGTYKGDFKGFQDSTVTDAKEIYDIISSGELKIDGHDGFYYTDEYDDGYGSTSFYTTIYIDNDDDTYFTVYYSGDSESYSGNMAVFRTILKNIKLDNSGNGRYLLPSFLGSYSSGGVLNDIRNYVYEDDIKALSKGGAFGSATPANFNPAGPMTRKDFVLWTMKGLSGNVAGEFEVFKDGYTGCSSNCFSDVDYNSDDAVYMEFAKSKGAIGALGSSGRPYFSPDAQISLVAALKIVFEIYDYDIWEAPSFIPWYIPYVQLGYKYGIIPYGVNDVNYLLTRGEAAHVINSGASGLSSYSDYWY
ncbi:MAG: S1C family serine protease [Candidatus Peregrinibacteria bacterium]